MKSAVSIPTAPPTNCATTNATALLGAIPAKLSDNMRPKTAAGFANDVLAVNQYAAPM